MKFEMKIQNAQKIDEMLGAGRSASEAYTYTTNETIGTRNNAARNFLRIFHTLVDTLST